MARVTIKGVHVVRRRLASGRVVEYHYAWRGGPRLEGKPGSAAYLAALEGARRGGLKRSGLRLRGIVQMYKASPAYVGLRPSTQKSYERYMGIVVERFGDMPVEALNDPDVRRDFIEWRDEMGDTPRAADLAVTMLKVVLSWARDRVIVKENFAASIGRLAKGDRSDSVWTDEDFEKFRGFATKELWWAVRLAALSGLRQGDLIRLAWSHVGGDAIEVRTSKRRRDVVVPLTPECKALLAGIEKRGTVVLTAPRFGRPWTETGIRGAFGKARDAAGLKVTFHDLRRTAATNLLRAGVEASQVAMIMGWSEADVEAMKRKYVSRRQIVSAVVEKLEGRTESVKRPVKRRGVKE